SSMGDDPGAFAEQLGINPDALSFLWDVPSEIRLSIFANFNPSGTKDGNVHGRLQGYVRTVMKRNGLQPPEHVESAAPRPRREHWQDHAPPIASQGADAGSVWAFAEQLGLPDHAAEFLGALPEDVAQSVCRGFDPSGTKDGNVWGRLLGYIRSLWQRRLQLTEEAASFIRSLPEKIQMRVMVEFDASGSKDGNVSARLVGFANHLANRNGLAAVPVVVAPRARPQLAGGHANVDASEAVADFATTLGLDQGAYDFMQLLPDDVKMNVVSSFDPSGTKDGNIWGRLFSFIRTIFSRHAGWDRSHVDQLKRLPEEQQQDAMLAWMTRHARQAQTPVPSYVQPVRHPEPRTYSSSGGYGGRGGGGADSTLTNFVRQWGLDERVAGFLQALPAHLRDNVLRSFDGSATQDGNVWGRLLGFVRSNWGRSLGIDQASMAYIKSMPEDAQMVLMTEFDPSGTKDGNIVGRLMGFAKKAMAMAQAGASAYPAAASSQGGSCPNGDGEQSLESEPAVMDFIQRCGLDTSALEILEPLPADVLATVIANFNPSGTKDGNVSGRLHGYVRVVLARRGLGKAGSGPAKRQRMF
ncbi:unnamed protein product, partial [Polarella glacialis]